MEPVSYCEKRKCDGPDGISSFPRHTCGSPALPGFNITSLLSGLPKYVRWVLSDIPWLNGIIKDALLWHGLPDFTVEVDEVLTQSFNWKLKNSEATWLVGCWPPQRYVVTDGEVHFPSGRVRLAAGGFDIVVSVYNLMAEFRSLRAELECHGGWWYLGGVGQDSAGTSVTPERFTAAGEVSLQCEHGWTLFCILLTVGSKQISAQVVRQLPAFLAGWLGSTKELSLGPGCPETLHNTVTVMPYTSKECCESSFVTDLWGCLVGGQFNGRHPSLRDNVTGVVCDPANFGEPGRWSARCDSLPGRYVEGSPGICREADDMMGNCSGPCCGHCTNDWPRTQRGLQQLAWADWLLTLALAWSLAGSCFVACISISLGGEGRDFCTSGGGSALRSTSGRPKTAPRQQTLAVRQDLPARSPR